MNKHTSTPWDINWGTAHDGESHHIVDNKDFGDLSIIAMVKFHDDNEGETRANAHLIAAAPDLLAACEWCANWTDTYADANVLPVVKALKAAIAKAKGEA